MFDKATTVRSTVLVIAVALFSSSGCSGCEDQVLDTAEQWLREDPDRPGKVGTLKALQVSQTARSVADWRLRRGDAPCDIGWSLNESFTVEFELQVDVDHRNWSRQWRENGTWQRDRDGRWEIDAGAEFESAAGLAGERLMRVYADDRGFWEWLGPDIAVRHAADASARNHWRREYGGRFAELMTWVSPNWQRAGDDHDDGGQHWIPGGERRLCGPVGGQRERSSWKPLLDARASRVRAVISTDGEMRNEGEERACRQLEATYRLAVGAQLEIRLRECHGPGPRQLSRREVQRVVHPRRGQHRQDAVDRLQEWIDEGLAEDVQTTQSIDQ